MLLAHEIARFSSEELAALSVENIDAAGAQLAVECSNQYAALCAQKCFTLSSFREGILQLLFLLCARLDLLEEKLKG